jgi:membrane dipeptidase
MKPPVIREEVRTFHDDQIVVDLHVDCVLSHRLFRYDIRKRHRAFMRRQPLFWHTDVPRMLEGGYSGVALGMHYWPRERERGWREVQKQLDYMERVVEQDDRVVRGETAADIETAHENGQIAFMAGLEGGHLIGQNLDHLEEARERGAVYLTLAHFSKNAACTPGMGRGANQTDGLTPFGHDLIEKLNDCEILVDVAHVNRPGVLEACEASRAPVIASHTSCVALQDNNRGVTDEGLAAIAETGGVIAIIFGPNFLRGKLNVSIDAVVDHIFHVAEQVGPEHLALGTDFDGWLPTIPNDLRDCRDMAFLSQRLIDRGMSHDDVSGLLGRNFLRVLRQVRGA